MLFQESATNFRFTDLPVVYVPVKTCVATNFFPLLAANLNMNGRFEKKSFL
jgi:hypothetical protein